MVPLKAKQVGYWENALGRKKFNRFAIDKLTKYPRQQKVDENSKRYYQKT